jgi:5-formyltetrahydrofolate cyclo-ligase
VVPLLAFDTRGYRVGYGAGFYDRTLARLRAARDVLAVGFAFAAQEFETVPHDEKDERLDWMVTEIGARKFER